MPTHSVVRRMSALTLAVILLLVGMPLPTSAAGEEHAAVACHRALTLNGRPLSQLLRTTVAAEGMVGLPGLVEQGTGQISGVALDAEGQPLVDHAVELRGVSEQGDATAVVATMATNTNGGFSFPGLSQGRYVVDVRADGRLVATSGPIVLAAGGMTFTQVGGVAAELEREPGWWSRLSTPGKLLVGVGIYVGAFMVVIVANQGGTT